ncbi:hypothetical protein TNCT_385321 [Trichonephila clavata]|uniref:RNA-directed DNA polymerase n=1 Tax=Trichonephila clavata TaxID=2740835 RepID=A0A8X6LZF6_TRICU|nr:hypothetical protein TNCT_385321 [Trichonephila clavata]
MEQQIVELLRQNQELIRALQIRDHSYSHKVTVQFEKFDEENENFDSFIERFETYLDVQNVPIANRAKGMDGVKVFMDDARITGSDEISHFTALEEFFKKCREHGLKLNLNKSKFFQNEINFLGHRIDSKGLHKTNEKISAVVNAPVPKNVHEVKSFLGLVNFYGKFCENLATIANPLNNLTKKNVRFLWSKDCQVAFEQIKKEICSPKVLVHYDPSLPLTLASDASPVGIGCALSHVYPDGSERPIAFASRTLSGSEKKYSQIDKEALSIVWAVKKFYLYLKGRRFTLITDHKPLVAIFDSKRGLPVLAATRLFLHYVLILKLFEFDIIFRKMIEHGNADFLSRLTKTLEELEVKDVITIFQMSQIEALPVTSKELRQETGKDIELCPLLKALRYKGDPTKAKVHYWEYPSRPWERIHVDFAGPIFEHTFFLIVDDHSKWLEVYPMKTTTTKKTIECLRDSFARFGLPRVLVSDNGSQFTSYEFQRFIQRNGVKHKTSAPFKPSSKGQAERYVATLKQSLRAMHKYIYTKVLYNRN